jgi:hypothetical protein
MQSALSAQTWLEWKYSHRGIALRPFAGIVLLSLFFAGVSWDAAGSESTTNENLAYVMLGLVLAGCLAAAAPALEPRNLSFVATRPVSASTLWMASLSMGVVESFAIGLALVICCPLVLQMTGRAGALEALKLSQSRLLESSLVPYFSLLLTCLPFFVLLVWNVTSIRSILSWSGRELSVIATMIPFIGWLMLIVVILMAAYNEGVLQLLLALKLCATPLVIVSTVRSRLFDVAGVARLVSYWLISVALLGSFFYFSRQHTSAPMMIQTTILTALITPLNRLIAAPLFVSKWRHQ